MNSSSRRRFLGTLAGSGAAAGLARLFGPGALLPQDPVPFDTLRTAYSLDPAITYLNHAAIGTIPRAVQQARAGYLATCESNPWLYMWGGAWEDARERVRAAAADLLGCRAGEIVLAHNTTEAFNLLASGLALESGDEVLFSSLNHAGASQCWHHHAAARGYTVRQFDLPLRAAVTLDTERLVALHEEQLRPETRVLVLPHIDNMIGLRHPIREITARARARGVQYVAVDGAQAVGMIDVDVAKAGVDFYATSPHKWLQAPKGLGLLYVREAVQADLRAMWVTWGQQRWKGSARVFEDYGTRNLPEVLALGDAIAFQNSLGSQRQQHLRGLHAHLRATVGKLKGVRWHSPETWEMGGSLCAVEVEGKSSTAVFDRLWKEHGIVVRAFAGADLNALRVSPNVMNTRSDIDRFCAALRA